MPSHHNPQEDISMNKTSKTHSIGQVANEVGIPKYKLRQWCIRYLTHIERIEIGTSLHRRFTEQDIELIRNIKEYRDKGFVLETAVEKAREELAGK
jgi:DNA-binding transcriptional MerR regulator